MPISIYILWRHNKIELDSYFYSHVSEWHEPMGKLHGNGYFYFTRPLCPD